jgi:hypothetical protein
MLVVMVTEAAALLAQVVAVVVPVALVWTVCLVPAQLEMVDLDSLPRLLVLLLVEQVVVVVLLEEPQEPQPMVVVPVVKRVLALVLQQIQVVEAVVAGTPLVETVLYGRSRISICNICCNSC